MAKYTSNYYVPVQKGKRSAFTCLGNWYDLTDTRSVLGLIRTLKGVRSLRDLETAADEISEAAHKLEG